MLFVRFRCTNGLFGPTWNRDRIDHVQNIPAEAVGVEQRVRVHEDTVAPRDMMPNPRFALIAILAMEPAGFDAAPTRNKSPR